MKEWIRNFQKWFVIPLHIILLVLNDRIDDLKISNKKRSNNTKTYKKKQDSFLHALLEVIHPTEKEHTFEKKTYLEEIIFLLGKIKMFQYLLIVVVAFAGSAFASPPLDISFGILVSFLCTPSPLLPPLSPPLIRFPLVLYLLHSSPLLIFVSNF